MISKTLTPPEHYSADVAYRALSPLRPFLDAASTKITTGLDAKTAGDLFDQLERVAGNLQQALESGQLDGSAAWKTKVGAALMDIAAIASVAGPIELKYSQVAAQTMKDSAANGTRIRIEEASAQTVFDQPDIDAITNAIDGVLEQ
jgi:hypothetical protein